MADIETHRARGRKGGFEARLGEHGSIWLDYYVE